MELCTARWKMNEEHQERGRTPMPAPPPPSLQAAPPPLPRPSPCAHSLLWEELLGFPMYFRMGFLRLSSAASLSFLVLLLCWPKEAGQGAAPSTRGALSGGGGCAGGGFTFLALGKKGSHFSFSWACSFSVALAGRGSLMRMPTWLM